MLTAPSEDADCFLLDGKLDAFDVGTALVIPSLYSLHDILSMSANSDF